MTNNNTFNASIIAEAKNALKAAQDALKEAKNQARNFMVDYIYSKDGEIVSVKELAEKTGLNPMTVGTMLARNNKVWSDTYKKTEKYVKLDEAGNPIMDEVKEITTRSAGYRKPDKFRW